MWQNGPRFTRPGHDYDGLKLRQRRRCLNDRRLGVIETATRGAGSYSGRQTRQQFTNSGKIGGAYEADDVVLTK